jgi:peptide/nickel transport system permease protein
MASLITRKIIIMLIILGLLNYVAYHYALLHPHLFFSPAGEAAEQRESHYDEYLQALLAGDLGEVARTPVAEVIRAPIKNSLILLTTALLTTITLGLLFGFLAISRRTRRIHPLALTFLAAGSSMPGFVLGAVLLSFIVYRILYSAYKKPLLPISGFGIDQHLILPVLVLAIQPTFHLAKVTAGLLENELQKDYIQVARSKGLSWWQLFWRHALPNMLSPILITIGEATRLMVGELVIVEAIFLWPGIGRIFLLTIGLRLDARAQGQFFGDPELIAIVTVILGSWLLVADLFASILAYRLDPRLHQAAEEAEEPKGFLKPLGSK